MGSGGSKDYSITITITINIELTISFYQQQYQLLEH